MLQTARWLLDSLILITLHPTIFTRVTELAPNQPKSLDAIHLVAALELGDELAEIITYNNQLAEAARCNGINVISPE